MPHRRALPPFVPSARLLALLLPLGLAAPLAAQSPGDVVTAEQKISDAQGDFTGGLENGDRFGSSLAPLGDLDGDGTPDFAVGAPGDDAAAGGAELLAAKRGAVWILFAGPDGKVDGEVEISDATAPLGLSNNDLFGSAVAALGDLDGDGLTELAVGAPGDDDGGSGRGAVWILFLDAAGGVKSAVKISDSAGGFQGGLSNSDGFGSSLAALGDLDGNGVTELAVGAPGDDTGGGNTGAVWILFLAADGTVTAQAEIDGAEPALAGALQNDDRFGISVAELRDLNGDTVPDLAVGAVNDDASLALLSSGPKGAVYVLFLNADASVQGFVRITEGQGGFGGQLENDDEFGAALGNLGDLDNDGTVELAVGAPGDGDSTDGGSQGAIWLLFLDGTGNVVFEKKVGENNGGFGGPLDNNDDFGAAVVSLGDLDGDGAAELGVSAPGDDDAAQGAESGGSNRGAVWVLFPTVAVATPFNGIGINPVAMSSQAPPALGLFWDPVIVDPATLPDPGDAIVVFLGGSLARPNQSTDAEESGPVLLPGAGELLISFLPGEYLFCFAGSPGVPYSIFFPPDPDLVGVQVFTQGFVFDLFTWKLTLTNGIDLLLGF